jgi:hypothetical protein
MNVYKAPALRRSNTSGGLERVNQEKRKITTGIMQHKELYHRATEKVI